MSQQALADPEWLDQHRDDPRIKLVEIAGMGQEDMAAYRAGHVPGAVCWDWKAMLWDARMRDFPSPAEFAGRLAAAGITNDTIVVFYGDGVQFGFYAWWTFRYCGHDNVKVLDGARELWCATGRPLTTEVPQKPAPAAYRPVARNEGMRVLRDEVLGALGQDELVILDARSPEEYCGERVGPPGSADTGAVRHGRIPGARHLYFADLLERTLAFRPVEELRALFLSRSAIPERDVIAYCRMSHRATVLYFALTQLLGYDRVRLYDGSWTEWGNLVGAPVER
jgi:thiosulfate/3-mercaptopyruvate sulfurtransferase